MIKTMKREKIDFTDKELYYIALSIKSHLSSRETYFSPNGARVFNSAVKKILNNGLKRKDPKSILHPIMKFDDIT